ncbi:hypothetical protein ACGF3G_10160 [Streptomyces sp. NPDC048179]
MQGRSLAVGRATYDGTPSDFFPGAVRDVHVYDRAPTPARIEQPTLIP